MKIEIGLATTDELRDCTGQVVDTREVTDILDDWRPVAVRGVSPGSLLAITEALVVVGVARSRNKMICTSPVEVMDADRERAQTASGSIYELGKQAEGDFPPGLLTAICLHLLK